MFERAEVVFPVRVVVLGEIVEQFHLRADGGLSGRRQSTVPLRLKHAPRYSHCPAQVVKLGDALLGWRCNGRRHGLALSLLVLDCIC